MVSPALAASAIPNPTLTRVVRAALGNDVAMPAAGWTVAPLPAMWESALRAGIYRVSGTAHVPERTGAYGSAEEAASVIGERRWSVVLRLSKPPPEGSSGAYEHEWRYWRREAHLVRSGLLDDLPISLLPPRTYLIEDQPAGPDWLWQEDLVPHTAGADPRDVLHPVWSDERLALAAWHLGELNGFFLRVGGRRLVPEPAWLCTTFLPQWVERVGRWDRWAAPLLEDAEAWAHPLVRLAFPDAGRQQERMRRLYASVPALLEGFAALPKTLCHLDAWPANLFPQMIGGAPVTRAIDWEFAGVDAVGADLGQFVLGSLSGLYTRTEDPVGFYHACCDAYLAGLLEMADAASHDGPGGLVRAARTGATIFGATRWGWLYTAGHVRNLRDAEQVRKLEQEFRLPIEHIAHLRGAAARLALDMADEACTLLAQR